MSYAHGDPATRSASRGLKVAALTILAVLAAGGTAMAAPVARYTYSPASPETGSPVSFDAGSSSCSAAPCTYTWADDGPDGAAGRQWPLGSGQNFTFTFRNVGTKYVRLTVRDATGATHSDMQAVRVAQAGSPPPPPPPPPPSGGCSRTATPSTFASQVAAAATGEAICLASGSYGTWQGTAKRITVRAAEGATPTMRVNFSSGDAGFTLAGMGGMGGTVGAAQDITIRDSDFTAPIVVNGGSGIVLDSNTHIGIDATSGSVAGRVQVRGDGLVVRNSLFRGGCSDGIQVQARNTVVEGNEFADFEADCANHTDMIQIYAPGYERGNVFRRNWFHGVNSEGGIFACYDTCNRETVENNLFDVQGAAQGRGWALELYSDTGSVVRNNTLLDGPCQFNLRCGTILITRKSQHPPGQGTVVVDNIASRISVTNGSTLAERHHNLVRSGAAPGDLTGSPVFMGPYTSRAGYRLAAGSAGKGQASDGLDIGIR